MRSEREIRRMLERCRAAIDFEISHRECPLGDNRCCYECTFPSDMAWVLGESDAPGTNLQDVVIEHFARRALTKKT